MTEQKSYILASHTAFRLHSMSPDARFARTCARVSTGARDFSHVNAGGEAHENGVSRCDSILTILSHALWSVKLDIVQAIITLDQSLIWLHFRRTNLVGPPILPFKDLSGIVSHAGETCQCVHQAGRQEIQEGETRE